MYDADFDLVSPVMDGTVLLTLTAGQQDWVEAFGLSTVGGTSIASGMVSWFSGHLISAM